MIAPFSSFPRRRESILRIWSGDSRLRGNDEDGVFCNSLSRLLKNSSRPLVLSPRSAGGGGRRQRTDFFNSLLAKLRRDLGDERSICCPLNAFEPSVKSGMISSSHVCLRSRRSTSSLMRWLALSSAIVVALALWTLTQARGELSITLAPLDDYCESTEQDAGKTDVKWTITGGRTQFGSPASCSKGHLRGRDVWNYDAPKRSGPLNVVAISMASEPPIWPGWSGWWKFNRSAGWAAAAMATSRSSGPVGSAWPVTRSGCPKVNGKPIITRNRGLRIEGECCRCSAPA